MKVQTVTLYAPSDYWRLTQEQKRTMCNGCGPKGFGLVVPDTVYGLRITEACNIHDWMYGYYEPFSDENKKLADRVLYNNIIRIVEAKTKWSWLKWLRRKRAYTYYLSVDKFGNCTYWSGKNKSEEEKQVII